MLFFFAKEYNIEGGKTIQSALYSFFRQTEYILKVSNKWFTVGLSTSKKNVLFGWLKAL